MAYLDDRERQLWEYMNTPQPPADIFAAQQKLERYMNAPGVIWMFRRAIAMFTGNDAVLPFQLRACLDCVDALIYEAFPKCQRFVSLANLMFFKI